MSAEILGARLVREVEVERLDEVGIKIIKSKIQIP